MSAPPGGSGNDGDAVAHSGSAADLLASLGLPNRVSSSALLSALTLPMRSYSKLSGDGEELSERWGELVLLAGEKVIIDDDGASIIMIFPKGTPEGGTIDPEERITEPLEMCRRIFDGRHGGGMGLNENGCFADFQGKGSVSAGLYHQVVRSTLLHVFEEIGLHASSFDSLDGDEVFLKLSLPRTGSVIKNLAQRHQYSMPFQPELCSIPASPSRARSVARDNESEARRLSCGSNKAAYGYERPLDNYGRPVDTYTAFEFEFAHMMKPFRQVDEIRLIQLCLADWLSVAELEHQNVISRTFPALNYASMNILGEHWGNLRKACTIPDITTCTTATGKPLEDEIRDYFGEEVAFFWLWFTFYVRMLVPLGIIGLFCASRFILLPENAQRRVEFGFSIFLLFWATVFGDLLKRRTDRSRQRWGTKDYEAITTDRPGYNKAMDGTWQNEAIRHLAAVGAATFCLLFIFAVGSVEYIKFERKMKGDLTMNEYGPLITVALIQTGSLIWNRIAPRLADLQNHKTQARWNDALTWILSGPKLFVALYPFLNIAFIKKFSFQTCIPKPSVMPQNMHSLANLSWQVYAVGWPRGIPNATEFEQVRGPEDIGPDFDLSWLRSYTYETRHTQCIWGCHPSDCVYDPDVGYSFSHLFRDDISSNWSCKTNCWHQLEINLETYWLFHIITNMILLVVPVVLTRLQIYKEIEEVRGPSSQGGERTRSDSLRSYSLMQYQAKCHCEAKYEYYSWGGSPVEDFLDLARGFALLTCFGIALPSMAFVALLSQLVNYRLYAFRMTHVTCRPWPDGAEGIGMWSDIFSFLTSLSVATNLGLAVFVMNPMQMWRVEHQLGAFLVLEHAMLFLREAIKASIPDEPEDVRRIDAFNCHFIQKIVKHRPYVIPKEEASNLRRINLGVCKWK